MIVESIIAILAAGTAASTVHRSVNPTAKEKQQQQKLKKLAQQQQRLEQQIKRKNQAHKAYSKAIDSARK